MQRQNLKYVILVAIAILGYFLLQKINANYYALWNANSLNVTATQPLSTDKVKIEFGMNANTINRSSDLDLFMNREKYRILFEGKNKETLLNEYGENDFLVTYDNKYYFSFRYFKFYRHLQHQYLFHFYQKDSAVFLKVDIVGSDPMRFERAMNLISDAQLLRCNSLIDSSKTSYNMIELTVPINKKVDSK